MTAIVAALAAARVSMEARRMWLLPLTRITWAVVLTAAADNAAPGGQPTLAVRAAALPTQIATRQTFFSIPFRIDQNDPRSKTLTSVQLYVSADRGATWHFHSTVEPGIGSFLFRAMRDGEYWFLIRTTDASGRSEPKSGERPGLRVAVDTTPPKLQLEVRRGDAGQIVARWQITDANPKPESLRLEYRPAVDQPWQAVALDRQRLVTVGGVCTGEVSWWPPSGSTRAEVRAEVADAAGNTSVSHAQVGAESTSGLPPKPIPDDGSLSRIALQINPATGDKDAPSGSRQPQASFSGFPAGGPPPRERIRMVSAARFQLEYDVESVGPSGVDRVELWGTRDGGRTWTSFGVDEDKQSPLVVTVQEEGIYGFHVAVRSGAGLGGEAPQPGDPPDVWVGVDWTKPLARITAAEQTTGERGLQLTIRWEAKDAMLAARPVSLYYAEVRGGPWSAIAVGLENSGRHTWTIEQQVPERIFLRLEVRDEAGNLGICETPEPVYLDRRKPLVRIRGVRPLDEPANGERR